MGTREDVLEMRLRVLALADQLRNVSLACRRAGMSRSHFYELKQAYQKHGVEGLLLKPRRRPRMPNQTPPEVEERILRMTETMPAASYVRVSQALAETGVRVTPSAVRYVWQRRGLTSRHQRLQWLRRRGSPGGDGGSGGEAPSSEEVIHT